MPIPRISALVNACGLALLIMAWGPRALGQAAGSEGKSSGSTPSAAAPAGVPTAGAAPTSIAAPAAPVATTTPGAVAPAVDPAPGPAASGAAPPMPTGLGEDGGPGPVTIPPFPVDLAAPGPAASGLAASGKPVADLTLAEVIGASIFGPVDYAPWTPLRLGSIFREGWRTPWISPPSGGEVAPRQGWIGAADGNFYRLSFLSYTFLDDRSTGGDGHTLSYTIYAPLSRRLLLIALIPPLNRNATTFTVGEQGFGSQGPGTGGSSAETAAFRRRVSFGDIAFTARVMLHETPRFSWTAGATIQAPSGRARDGAGRAFVTPSTSFWWNFADRWVVRGGFSVGVPTNREAGGPVLLSQLAVGRTFTPHDTPLFGDFTLYLSSNTASTPADGGTSVILTPGLRTHLGGDWYFLAGTGIPVTGPRPFSQSAIFWFMKAF